MLTVTDLFAGAGGSSCGAIQVPGVEVYIAANHWAKAVEVHNTNHPDALHVCADVSQIDPRRFPKTDILWASPECTMHSIARGNKDHRQPDLFGEVLPDEATERSRATMWDVPRFAEAHRYQAVIVENVIEIRRWAPFKAWLQAMDSLGYEHQEVFLNSAYAQAGGLPAPQSRDRIYVVFWRRGNKRPDLERWTSPQAFCPHCQVEVSAKQVWKRPERPWGRYRTQYTYNCPTCWNAVEPGWLPAAAAIDWGLPGDRIADRKRPLADKTRRRIAAGIARYWHQPFIAELRGGGSTARSVKSPLATITAGGQHHGLVEPLQIANAGSIYDSADPRHPKFNDPNGYYRVRPISDTMRTLTGWGDTEALVAPYYGTSDTARPVDEPIGALTTRDRYALVTRHYSSSGDGAEMSKPAHEALGTLTTSAQQSIVTPGEIEAAAAQVDDCLFRMLEPHEVAAGMAFPGTYQWLGTRRERVKMAGNAVTPPAARDLIAAVAEALMGVAA